MNKQKKDTYTGTQKSISNKIRQTKVVKATLLMSVTAMFLGLLLWFFASRIEGNLPKSRIVGDSLCLHFVDNSGASPHRVIAVIECENLEDAQAEYKQSGDVWEDSSGRVVSAVSTIDCPWITVNDTDGQVEILVKKSKTCDFFEPQNPLTTEEIVELRYTVNEDGELIETERKVEEI